MLAGAFEANLTGSAENLLHHNVIRTHFEQDNFDRARYISPSLGMCSTPNTAHASNQPSSGYLLKLNITAAGVRVGLVKHRRRVRLDNPRERLLLEKLLRAGEG